jgi:hypothetical protein
VARRTRKVSHRDASGVEHTVEVTARSLYEAAGRGLHFLSQNDWIDGIHSKFDNYNRRVGARGRAQGPDQGLRKLARIEWKISC